MISTKNQRVYLVLDPDEAAELQLVLQRSILTGLTDGTGSLLTTERKKHKMLRRLERAIGRAKEKGAKFTK